MKLLKIIQKSIIILACVLPTVAGADDATINRYKLKNGIRVVIVHVPRAARQTTLTFLPLSLSSDPANRGQWSHLLEHMLIRSTDPVDLFPEGLQLNGETKPEYLRLDTYALPEKWKESVDRHARWIAARSFDAETLDREKIRITGEENAVSASGYTHKFAVAAWNQIVRRGLEHAAIHGDVEGATVENVEAFAKSNIGIDETILVASIGPTDPEELLNGIKETIGELPHNKRTEKIELEDEKIDLKGTFQGTWDLDATHLMMWWKLPDTSFETRMASQAAGHLLVAQLHRKLLRQSADIRPMVYPTLILPEGDFLLINLNVPDEEDVKQVEQMVLAQIAEMSKTPAAITQTGLILAKRFDLPDDFDKLRKQYGARASDYLEGNILLQFIQLEYAIGVEHTDIAKGLRALSEESVTSTLKMLQEPPTGTLILLPKKSE